MFTTPTIIACGRLKIQNNSLVSGKTFSLKWKLRQNKTISLTHKNLTADFVEEKIQNATIIVIKYHYPHNIFSQ